MSKLTIKNHLYSKFLGFLNKTGFKLKAKNILSEAFVITSKKTGLSTRALLLKIFFRLNTFIEVKKVRVKRRLIVVPFYVNYKRRLYLVVKWFMQAVKADKRRISLANKISFEILQIIRKKFSKSIKIKDSNISQAFINRSNMHFRW